MWANVPVEMVTRYCVALSISDKLRISSNVLGI